MFDVHCHILPGVDDGSRNKDESLAMLARAKEIGIDKIVCTPHYKSTNFSEQAVNDAFDWFVVEAEKIGIEAVLGYEIHWKKISELGLETVVDHAIGDTEYALIEFSEHSEIGQLEQRMIWKLRSYGITPILAHPERYACMREDLSIADDLKGVGCLFQMSADAVADSFFSKRRKFVRYLLKQGMYDCVASDAHCPEDYDDYVKALKLVKPTFTI